MPPFFFSFLPAFSNPTVQVVSLVICFLRILLFFSIVLYTYNLKNFFMLLLNNCVFSYTLNLPGTGATSFFITYAPCKKLCLTNCCYLLNTHSLACAHLLVIYSSLVFHSPNKQKIFTLGYYFQ